MNAIKLLLPAAAALSMLFAACESDSAKPLSDIKDADRADSLLYYYGQMRAGEYWRHAEGDTALASEENRKKFLKGMVDGINSIKENDEIYNDGFRLGVRVATGMNSFTQDYGDRFRRSVFISSIRYGLESEDRVDPDKAQREYFEIKGELDYMMQQQDAENGRKALAKEARLHKFKKISDFLYYEIQNPGSGPLIVPGDVVYVDVTYLRINGFNLGVPSPEKLAIGSHGLPEVVNVAYCNLRKGSRARFMTTAGELFGDRAEIIGLRMSDLILVTANVKDVVAGGETADSTLNITKP